MERSYERLGAAYLDDLKAPQRQQPQPDINIMESGPPLDITVGIDPQISVGPINRSERLINRASI